MLRFSGFCLHLISIRVKADLGNCILEIIKFLPTFYHALGEFKFKWLLHVQPWETVFTAVLWSEQQAGQPDTAIVDTAGNIGKVDLTCLRGWFIPLSPPPPTQIFLCIYLCQGVSFFRSTKAQRAINFPYANYSTPTSKLNFTKEYHNLNKLLTLPSV